MIIPSLYKHMGIPIAEHHVTSFDGLSLFVSVYGNANGKPIVCCNGIGVSTFYWSHLLRYFGDRYKIITWDYRAHGRSQTPPPDYVHQFNHHIRDLDTVITRLNLQNPILIAHSMGVQVILDYASHAGKKISAVIPLFGTFGHAMKRFFDWNGSEEIFQLIYKLQKKYPAEARMIWEFITKNPSRYESAKLFVVNGDFCKKEEMDRYFDHLATIDLGLFMEMIRQMNRHSAKPKLHRIKCPTIVFGATHDVFTPLTLSLELSKRIAGAELCIVQNGSHVALVEQPELINLRVEKFLNTHNL